MLQGPAAGDAAPAAARRVQQRALRVLASALEAVRMDPHKLIMSDIWDIWDLWDLAPTVSLQRLASPQTENPPSGTALKGSQSAFSLIRIAFKSKH